MDILDETILDFWQALNSNKVLYIMVGGFAVNMHGFNRTTKDIDIWIKDSIENRNNFGKAMSQFGYDGSISWQTIQFIPGWTDFKIGSNIIIDVMINMKGLDKIDFDEAYSTAKIGEILNLQVPFLHINHLIANKKAVNRPKDQIDVIELEKIVKIQQEGKQDNNP
jgi:hypothetical protein